MEKSVSCAVVVCSCDKYSDLWDPYFELFKKFWADCPYPVFLNTETKRQTKNPENTVAPHSAKNNSF